MAYDLKGKLVRKGSFRNGRPHGKFIDHVPGGEKREETYVRGARQGICHAWDAAGHEVGRWGYVDDQLQGVVQRRDAFGHLIHETHYKDDQRHGSSRDWNSAGKLVREQFFHEGRRHGTNREWDKRGQLVLNEQYADDVPHGPFMHRRDLSQGYVAGSYEHGMPNGKWSWLPGDDGGRIVGEFLNGCAHGRWEWTSASGEVYLTTDFSGGQTVRLEPGLLSPRILERLAGQCKLNPGLVAVLFSPLAPSASPLTLEELAASFQIQLQDWGAEIDWSTLNAASGSKDQRVPSELRNEPRLLLLAHMLRPYSLGFDLRYGILGIDSIESIAAWRDTTGVTSLIPPPGSQLERVWNERDHFDFIECPIKDVFDFLSGLHQVQFDLSRLPSADGSNSRAISADTPLRISAVIEFHEALGAILSQVGCKGSLQGETIVIEAQ